MFPGLIKTSSSSRNSESVEETIAMLRAEVGICYPFGGRFSGRKASQADYTEQARKFCGGEKGGNDARRLHEFQFTFRSVNGPNADECGAWIVERQPRNALLSTLYTIYPSVTHGGSETPGAPEDKTAGSNSNQRPHAIA